MRCGRVSSLVDRYVDGVLPPRQAEEIERHARGCPRCATEIAAARRLLAVFAEETAVRAPRGFADRVMGAVYRQAPLRGAAEQGETPHGAQRGSPLPMYRRLGLSFLLTAAALTASLLIPRAAYPSLLGGGKAGIEVGSAVAVKRVMAGAENTVRGILGGQEAGGMQ